MKLPLLAACAAAVFPVAAAAADAADPAVPVPAPAYRSAFEGLPAGIEPDTLAWKEANEAVGAFSRGHIDLLKWEQSHPAPAASPPAPGPAAQEAR